ncbi:MAG: cytochrome c [Bryobacteraceae bacterium]|nr:cytochrome c [Bryobacteraceae bacterium]
MNKTILLGALPCALLFGAPKAEVPTFNKDIQPILAKNCMTCHRTGEIGPMALTSYKEARPWAKAIKASVASKKMPPWFADPAHGKFQNDRSMPQADIEKLVAWADNGAPEGKPKELAANPQFVDGWNIPTPDLVITMPQPFEVPKEGKVDYQYIVIPMNLKEDKWIQMAEARATARNVVHHIVVFSRAPESKWLRGEAEPGIPFVPPRTFPDGRPRSDIGGMGNEILTIYTPGNVPDIWKPGQAKFIKAGSDIVLQLHYTPNGKEAVKDQSRVGLVFAKEPPKERVATFSSSNMGFAIPPGDPNYAVTGATRFAREVELMSFFPHMHLRGKSFEYRLVPNGSTEKETVLKVPKYDFNWQLTYKLAEPMKIAPGTRIEATGWFDNSPNNPYNPDPKATVRFGEQSWEEMMIGFFDVSFDAKLQPRDLFRPAPPAQQPSPSAAARQ